MRKLLLLTLLLAAVPGLAQAQWTYDGYFPDSSSTDVTQTHGLAVDPDGKVWTQAYYPFTGDSVFVEALGSMQRVTALYCFNPDGSQCDFSPLTVVSFNGTPDTLGGAMYRDSNGNQVFSYASGRGLRTDHEGNILAAFHHGGAGLAMLYRINYKDGTGMDMANLLDVAPLDTRGTTAPAVDEVGNIFITGVFPGDPLVILNSDFTFRETAIDSTNGFSRAFEVSPDGNTIYWAGYSTKRVQRYSRASEFDPFPQEPDSLLGGFAAESFAWDPKTGWLWISAGSHGDVPNEPQYMRATWYAFDVNDFSIKQDSIVWAEENTVGKPRAIDFSPDGEIAYVGVFDKNLQTVQRFLRGDGSAVEPTGEVATGFALRGNYPNPFSGATTIEFALPLASHATLKVYDTLGREVATLVDEMLAPDTYRVGFDASALPSGLYLYRLDAGNRSLTGTMTVVQ